MPVKEKPQLIENVLLSRSFAARFVCVEIGGKRLKRVQDGAITGAAAQVSVEMVFDQLNP